MKILGIYDNNGATVDQYTVVTNQNDGTGYNTALSLDPGGNSYGWGGALEGDHLGRMLSINDVPEVVAVSILKNVFWSN